MSLEDSKKQRFALPEFSDVNYRIAGYIFALLITVSGGFFIYEILADGDLTFSAEWNIFKSKLGNLCIIIGFLWAMAWWGKFTHWSRTPITKTYDGYGNLKRVEEDFDISNQLFAKFLMPLLGHFVIEPIIYGCVIYYPLQCVIALVGAIFPYVISVIIIAIMVLFWRFTSIFQFRNHSAVLIAAGLLLSGAFSYGAYSMYDGSETGGYTITTSEVDNSQSRSSEDENQVTNGSEDEFFEDNSDGDDEFMDGME